MILDCKNYRIIYPTDKDLEKFDNRIFAKGFGGVKNKVDYILDNVSQLLGIKDISHMKFDIILMKNKKEVSEEYYKLYALSVDYVAFYAPDESRVYLALDYVNKPILAHELAHMIIDKYFVVGVTREIHEIIAEFVERHI